MGAQHGHINLRNIDPRGHRVLEDGKYGRVEERFVNNVFFDLASATLTTAAQSQRRIIRNGVVGAWNEHSLINIVSSKLGISELLSYKDITDRRLDSVVPESSRGGKYGNS